MLVAASTGFPMVTGSLHQDEQRAGVYARLYSDRQADMQQFFTTPDVQRALTIISKYDIDYVYLGQLEQAEGGQTGSAKFSQMADPKVGILKEVFRSEGPEGEPGTIIYQVVKDAKTIVGAPVANSGIPGISITPIPTAPPTPMPTPPVDDPTLKALIAAVAANPSDSDARTRLINWYRDHGFFLDAARELETLVKQDPQNIALRHMLGDAYQAGGQPDKALKAWEDARDLHPDNPDVHNKVGLAYTDRKRYDDAIREFQAAVAADAGFTESWVHLGEVYEIKGDKDNARKSYQSGIDKAREQNDWVKIAQSDIAKIR
jgi:tetratricopeptide (TPR) repeat protein